MADYDDMMKRLEKRLEERKAQKRAEVHQAWLDQKAVQKGELRGHKYWIVPGPGQLRDYGLGGLNGYIHFEKRPLKEEFEDGILVYVPVHGGITYSANHDGGIVYGFDTSHFGSEELPRNDPAWVLTEIEAMLDGIEMAARLEPAYLASTDPKERERFAEQVASVRPAPLSLPAALRLLSGER